MQPLTLISAYYRNPKMLGLWYDALAELPGKLKWGISVIIVDDCSGEPIPAPAATLGMPLRIYSLKKKVRWNQDACRNLAVSLAPAHWILLTDMDHLVTPELLGRLIHGQASKDIVYKFQARELPDFVPAKPHANSWFMHRDTYLRAGGYDERFSGLYGTDADFRDRVLQVANIIWLDEWLIRVPTTVVSDASTPGERKTAHDRKELARITAERAKLPNPVTVWKKWDYELVVDAV